MLPGLMVEYTADAAPAAIAVELIWLERELVSTFAAEANRPLTALEGVAQAFAAVVSGPRNQRLETMFGVACAVRTPTPTVQYVRCRGLERVPLLAEESV